MNHLHDACERGDLEEVASLLSNDDCNINAFNTNGESPLHIACKYGHLEIVKILQKSRKCKLSTSNSCGDTPLHFACYNKFLHIMKVLLEMRCKTNLLNDKGDTAQDIPLDQDGGYLLHIACQWGDVGIVRYLITDERCNLNVQTSVSANTPLHVTIGWGNASVISELLAHKQCDINIRNKVGDTPLHSAIRQWQDDIIVQLLSHKECGLNVQNKVGDTPLHIAVKQNRIATILQLLATNKCDPNIVNSDIETPLHIAVRQVQDETIVKLLSCKECDLNIKNREGDTPLHIACCKKSLGIARLLLEKRCSTNIPNNEGDTVQDIPLNEHGDCILYTAFQWGDLEIVRHLIIEEKCNPNVDTAVQPFSHKKCDLNVQNKEGDTLVHIAVRQNKTASLYQLLDLPQCNINLQNKMGDSPLHIAVRCQSWYSYNDTCTQLLSCKACDLNIQNKEGDTPLHIAVRLHKTFVIFHLLANQQCNVNVQNKMGDTPLHIAVKQNRIGPISQLLATNECDPNIQNTDSELPLDIAVRQGHDYIISELFSFMKCDPNVKNEEGDTPLRNACYGGIIRLLERRCSTSIPNSEGDTAQDILSNEEKFNSNVDTAVQLFSHEKCDLNVQNKDGDTLVHIAVRQNKTVSLYLLLNLLQCNINLQNKMGDSPLHIAVRCQSWYSYNDTCTQLLSCKACDLNIQNKEGDTPLHIAVRLHKTVVIFHLLANQQCDINLQNKMGDSPLHIAVRCQSWYSYNDTCTQLLSCKACDLNIQNKEGDTPLHIAVRLHKTFVIFHLLANQQCDVNVQNKMGDTPLHIAVKQNRIGPISQLLATNKCDPNIRNTDSELPLDIAVRQGHDDIISELFSFMKCGPSVKDRECDTSLHIAWSLEMVGLLERRCSANIPNKKDDEAAQDILKNEEKWNPSIDTAVQLFSHEKCDLNVQNKDGDTLVHIAVRQNKTVSLYLLLNLPQCNINLQNKMGDSPLHIAVRCKAWYSYNDTCTQLLSCKACDLNIQNKDGDTPLHIAVRLHKTVVIFHLLANQQCDINVQNEMGDTPLHIAVKENRIAPILQLLATNKCDPNIRNTDSELPLDIAVRQGHDDIISELFSFMKCGPSVKDRECDTSLHIAWSLEMVGLLERRCSANIPNKKDDETAQDILKNEEKWNPSVDTAVQLFSHEKCDLNVQNKDGDTLVHIAVRQNKTVSLYLLLNLPQCNINLQNKMGDSPLHIAVRCKGWYSYNDTCTQLLSCKACDLNIQNKEGDTPLHIAVRLHKTVVIFHLLANQQCDVNVQNKMGDTPLHIAVKQNRIGPISQLLATNECDPNIRNTDSETPLHIAVRQGHDNTISELVSFMKCGPNVRNGEGDTPLNDACYKKSLHIIRHLLEMRCRTNIPNKDGVISQDIPLNEDEDCLLHIACQWGDVGIVRYLTTDERCHLNIQNANLDTPLHIACYIKNVHIIRHLLELRCSTSIPNRKGETAQDIPLSKDGDKLLHIACQWGDVDIVRYLINDEGCDPNVQSYISENTPLHVAVINKQNDTVEHLLSCEECDPNVQNKDADTPLHIAVRHNITPPMCKLLTNKQCNPNIVNKDHLTPLLLAIKDASPKAAAALLQHNKCDPTVCDLHGNTPLHLACLGSETQPEMLEVAKRLLTSVDPSCINNAGQTPIELTTNYQLIRSISDLVKCKTKQSVQTYINMFIVGNPMTGKSTLVKAICTEASILWKIVPKNIRRVKNVPLHTAGIIPTTFRSKTFGNTVLHDLAGQVEYYTSHAAVIQSTVISTPPAFIVVINLSESKEKISQTLRYWWSFIDNHAAKFNAPPQVILVGSNADVVKSTGGSIQEKMTQISSLLKQLAASFHFAGQVALDCRDPASKNLQHFCALVKQSCTALRKETDVDFHCHVLYAFLHEKFEDKVACKVSDLITKAKESSALLPQNPERLIPLISMLSDKGLLFLVKGDEHRDWWIIIQKQALISVIIGVLFAPKYFRQYKILSWNTGVVPFSKLKTEFPDYNPEMIAKFLIHLEFCFKIKDHEMLGLLKDEAANLEDTPADVSDEYYFFPALVSVENPLHVWEENDDMCIKCGWFYQCIQEDQFLTTQFLHVLILRLAFTFALKLQPGDFHQSSISFCRRCPVWKHGIAWLTRAPIETVVEVGLQHQSVTVLMRCPKGEEDKCVQLRSKVIKKVLEAKDEYCKAVKMSESFVHPKDVKYPFTDNIEDIKLYNLTEIAMVTISKEGNALDRENQNPIPVQDLLLFNPYNFGTNAELLRELFSEKHSIDVTVRRQVLKSESEELHVSIMHVQSNNFVVSLPYRYPAPSYGIRSYMHV